MKSRRRRRRRHRPRVIRIHGKSFKQEDLPSGTESRESHLDFIALNWELGAALAWKGYQEEGRGAVVVFSEKAKTEWARNSDNRNGEHKGRSDPQQQSALWYDED